MYFSCYRYPNGRVCGNRPIRQDYLDEVVWEHRLEAIQQVAPTKRRKEAIVKELARVLSGIGKLLDAYQEGVVTLDELRQRVPNLRKREKALKAELRSLEAMTIDQQAYLQLAESVEEFLSRLRASASTLSVIERQKILRLVVKEILVDRDTIKMRHSIPVTRPNPTPAPSGGDIPPGYLLGKGSRLPFCMPGACDEQCAPFHHQATEAKGE